MPPAPGTTIPYPKLRNFVLDVLAEGRRKQIAHVLFEADVGGIKEQLAELRLRGEPVSMTSYIAKSFACAIADDRRMQAYRLGRSRLVVFDDVDLAFMIEREWEGERTRRRPFEPQRRSRHHRWRTPHAFRRAFQAGIAKPDGLDAVGRRAIDPPPMLSYIVWALQESPCRARPACRAGPRRFSP